MSNWEVREGDCLALMADMKPGSVDCCVTDPPYGLSFMGAGWDHAVPGVPFWLEALRVAKPGAHLLAFGGTRTFHRLAVAVEDAGWEIRDTLSWIYGEGFPKSHNGPWGGTALKPAWEPVIMARKPLRGTVAANHEAFGTGALNIDGCRIGTDAGWSYPNGRGGKGWHGRESLSTNLTVPKKANAGRWPANVCLDECAAAELDRQSGETVSTARVGARTGRAPSGLEFGMGRQEGVIMGHNDSGGASRFFYVAKPDRAERDMGIHVALKAGGSNVAGVARDVAAGLDRNRPVLNNHPTVKPVALMRWLCRLVTPSGGLVLDPFCGSGTTGVAAVGEGFRFIGMELEPRYAEIARARLANTQAPLFDLAGTVAP